MVRRRKTKSMAAALAAAAPAAAEETPRVAPLDNKIVRRVAHALWDADLQTRLPEAEPNERKQDWDAEKGNFVKRARRLLRTLERQGITATSTQG